MGLVSFLFLAAVSSWSIFGVARLVGLNLNFHRTVELLFGAAAMAGLYGVFNASWTRITRTTVRLANLPAAWRGRRAALISDVHLRHVRNGGFLRRLVAKIAREQMLRCRFEKSEGFRDGLDRLDSGRGQRALCEAHV
jgi:hypothetical protein